MARKPKAADAARNRFAALLDHHLKAGIRPATATGEPWTYAAFAAEVASSRANDFVSPRSPSNWCRGKTLPEEVEPILRALFGPTNRHGEARDELREAFQAARAEKNAAVLARANAKPDPAGATWVVEGDRFALDRTARPTDRRAAADPLRQQLQHAIRAAAADLAEGANRLSNTRAWAGLSRTAAAFGALVAGDPLVMPDRLGEAYPLMLRLGRCLETDRRLQRDPARMDEPLDADIHGQLLDLVRIAAPWLRGFPTVARWDDEAGKALVRAELFHPAGEFLRIARESHAISDRDAAEIKGLTETAGEGDFQGEKAGARAVGSARNLLIAGAEAVAVSRTQGGTPPAERERLVARAAATLAAARDQVRAIAETLPEDLSQALLAIAETPGQPGEAMRAPPPDPSVPDDVEAQARALILDGQSPPVAWRPFIRELDFSFTGLTSLALLAGLSGLQRLSLSGTQVSDVAPLSGLSSLQRLDLGGTQVSDVAPLSGLNGLQRLELWYTPVSDVAPLSSLSGLQRLDLDGTQVSDVAPLSGLSGLQSLVLTRTPVSDVAPLSSLSGLQRLDLGGTQVSDVAPLSGLSGLQSLDLDGTQVSDVAPLSGLSGLQSLHLAGTQVSDVAPLSGLSGLQSLDLTGTQVSDVTLLSGLSGLQSLDLTGTQVSDVAPLSGLSGLQSLVLTRTPVSDVAPLSSLSGLQRLVFDSTQVSDVTPLSSLSGLQSLHLGGTPVSDVMPLSGLNGLQSLDLTGTPVSDVAPLSGLNGLQSLVLTGTPVSDVTPLSRLSGLQSLDLTGTPVSDVAPLSSLSSLQSLVLTRTPVSDVTPLSGLAAQIHHDLSDEPRSVGPPSSVRTEAQDFRRST